jgi:hypothetical protein
MRILLYFATKWLENKNKILRSNNLDAFNKQSTQRYLKVFEFVFTQKTKKFDQKRFLELCDLNALYALQLKLNVTLSPWFHEVAYDFDNPDYPGYGYISEKIRKNEYDSLGKVS